MAKKKKETVNYTTQIRTEVDVNSILEDLACKVRELSQRIDRIVLAISKSKSVKKL